LWNIKLDYLWHTSSDSFLGAAGQSTPDATAARKRRSFLTQILVSHWFDQ
jgi:hypothetical protein